LGGVEQGMTQDSGWGNPDCTICMLPGAWDWTMILWGVIGTHE